MFNPAVLQAGFFIGMKLPSGKLQNEIYAFRRAISSASFFNATEAPFQ